MHHHLRHQLRHHRGLTRNALALSLVLLLLAPLSSCTLNLSVLSGDHHQYTPFIAVLCKFNDHAEEPQTPQWFQDFLSQTGRGKAGLFDYWLNNSLGTFNLTGSKVFGWYTLSHDRAYYTLYGSDDEKAKDNPDDVTYAARTECLDNAKGEIQADNYAAIMTIFNYNSSWCRTVPAFDDASQGIHSYGLAVMSFDPRCTAVSTYAHEMGHAYGLGHTWATKMAADPHSANHVWKSGRDVEYGDPWDLMSIGQAQGYADATYAAEGPELAAPYRYLLGFIPTSRIYQFAPLETKDATVQLAAVDKAQPGTPYLVVYYPINSIEGYMLEYRANGGYDQALPDKAVLLYEWRTTGSGPTARTAYLIMKDTGQPDFDYTSADVVGPEWQAGQTFTDTAHGVTIKIKSLNADDTATIELVYGTQPSPGFVGVTGCTPHCPKLSDVTTSQKATPDQHVMHLHPFNVGFPKPVRSSVEPTPTANAPAHLSVTQSPSTGSFDCYGSGSAHFPNFLVGNTGGTTLTWAATTNDPTYITLSPARGSVDPGGRPQLVQPSGSGHVATLQVSFTSNGGSAQFSIPCGKP